jgi:hypothetical protein
MSKALSIAHRAVRQSGDPARLVVVLACATALILAGEALPF